MKFGPVPVGDAAGAIAAHSVRAGEAAVKKGQRLTHEDVARLAATGVRDLVVARLGPGDVPEDEAAARVAGAIAGEGVRVAAPFTGRTNLFAEVAGLLCVEREAIDRLNGVDESVTLATLPHHKAVMVGEMIATVKIIPFAVPQRVLDAALAGTGGEALVRVAPFRPLKVGVISTLLPGLKPSVVRKTIAALEDRLRPMGARLHAHREVAHEAAALAREVAALAAGEAGLLVVFGASAITDRRDVIPAAIEAAGGRVEHLGMPVDPGNLLLLGSIAGKPVIGAPGCARSPRENGFDWVLQRLVAGLPVTSADIAGMGVGGLLMEIGSRPQPRAGGDRDEEA